MKSLGQQFADKMRRRVKPQKFKAVTQQVAKHLERQIKERTRRGRPLPNGGRWDRPYNKEYAERHNKTTVNLRLSGQSMNNLRGTTRGDNTAQIRANDLLRMHDEGDVKGNKVRQIAPENKDQIPRQMKSMIKFEVKKILQGGTGQQSN